MKDKVCGTDVQQVALEICNQDSTIWFRLGKELRVNDQLLSIIESAEPLSRSCNGCCRYMLHLWMASSRGPYTMVLLTALVNIQQLTACRNVLQVLKK